MSNNPSKPSLDATLSDFAELLKERASEEPVTSPPDAGPIAPEPSEQLPNLTEAAARLRAEEQRLRQESQRKEQQRRLEALQQKQSERRAQILVGYHQQEPAVIEACAAKAKRKRRWQVGLVLAVLGITAGGIVAIKASTDQRAARSSMDTQHESWLASERDEATKKQKDDTKVESALREQISALQSNIKKNTR